MHVPNLEKALMFFRDTLRFKIRYRFENYAYVERKGVAFRLLEGTGDDTPPPGNRRFAYYIDVRDVDRLYAKLKPKLDLLPAGTVHGPIDQSYGQRELLVVAPDGNLLAFGHAIERKSDRPRGRK